MDAELRCHADTVSRMMKLKSELSCSSLKELSCKMLQMAVLIADNFFSGTFHALNPKGAREHHEGGVVSIFPKKRLHT